MKLGKTAFYCQLCQKQCRDSNGFKSHLTTLKHKQIASKFASNPDALKTSFSVKFKEEMTYLIKLKATNKTNLNYIYQEYIQDPLHVHLNATKWSNLTDFAHYLSESGDVDLFIDSSKLVFVTWIDKSVIKSVAEKPEIDLVDLQLQNAKKIKLDDIKSESKDQVEEIQPVEKEHQFVKFGFKIQQKPNVLKKSIFKKEKIAGTGS